MNGHILRQRRLGAAVLVLALTVLLAGCTSQPTPAPAPAVTAVPTIPLQTTSGKATASGAIVPAHKASLGFTAAGRVQSSAVAEGDQVEAGALLLTLDQANAQAAVAQAESALTQAQAHLDELRSGARPQEIAAAQARVEAAQARLTQVTEGASDEEIAAARAALAAAQAAQQELYRGPGEQDKIAAQAALDNARSMGAEPSLIDFEGLTPQMIEALAKDGVKTLDDFATCADWELAGGWTTVDGQRVKDDGILEPFDMSLEEAQTLIMTARVQLGWVDPADLAQADEDETDAEGDEE